MVNPKSEIPDPKSIGPGKLVAWIRASHVEKAPKKKASSTPWTTSLLIFGTTRGIISSLKSITMPLLKLENLCSEPPDGHADNRLDDLAMKIFGQTALDKFVLSSELPRPRYRVGVNTNLLNQVTKLDYNDRFLASFRNLGPNEKYIVHKIFYSSNNIVCMIGGIGVGKTAFTHYFVKTLLPDILHENTKDPKRCPAVVMFDFKLFDKRVFPREPESAAIIGFSKNLALQISSSITAAGYFSISDEVNEVWNSILEEDSLPHIQNPALSWLRVQLRAEDLLLDPTQTYDQRTLESNLSRRKILRERMVTEEHSIAYFAALLGFIKRKFFDGHTPCLVVIIDNVDRELSTIHRITEDQLKIFSNLCDVRIVFNVRQTTHHQGTDNFQQLVDKVPYCGPDPVEIVYDRLDNFLEREELYENCLAVYGPELKFQEFYRRLQIFRDKYLTDSRFVAFFRALCGSSVRKGLKIAQNLIHTSIFDLTDDTDNRPFSANNIIRALMVGPSDYYNENGVIENLFRISNNNKLAYFVKIRILKALDHSHDNGLTLNFIVNSLEAFGYKESLVLDAVYDLMRDDRRLIWLTTAIENRDSLKKIYDEPIETKAFLSSIGSGYVTYLLFQIQYVQEVMMDTMVDSDYFKAGSNHGDLLERFAILSNFIKYLRKVEMKELELYMKNSTVDEYLELFGRFTLISVEIIQNISNGIYSILEYVVKSTRSDEYRNKVSIELEGFRYYFPLEIAEAGEFLEKIQTQQ